MTCEKRERDNLNGFSAELEDFGFLDFLVHVLDFLGFFSLDIGNCLETCALHI